MKSLHEHIIEALEGSKMTYSGKNQDFVDVILENPEGKILILRRANYMKNFRTCWGVIGGAVDIADKTLKDAAVRETVEETGISLSFNEVNNMKHLFDYKYKDGNVSHVFWTRLETKIDKVKISREHSKYEWVNFSDEKIDERKWMPEVFNILQKWEQTPVNEKLIINKDAKIIGVNSKKIETVIAEDTEDLCNIIDIAVDEFAKKCPDFSEVLDLNYIDVSKIERFHNLFDAEANENFRKIKYIDISNWDMRNAYFCSSMFIGAEELISVGDLSNWTFTDKLNTLRGMFSYCYELDFIGDISNWNVSHVNNFNRMFKSCRSLNNVGDLNKWNIREDASKKNMFFDSALKTPKWYDRNKEETT